MAGKLSGTAIETGTISTDKLDANLNSAIGVLKVSSIVYPNSASNTSTSGNESIQLVGTGFDSNANVFINYTIVSNVTVANSTSLTFTTPAQNVGTYLLQVKNPDGTSITAIPGIEYATPAPSYTFQGTVSGYTSGGDAPPRVDTIDKFSFVSNANATDVGNLTQARNYCSGQSSEDNGYTSSGYAPSAGTTYVDTIDKFPFASDGNATDVGNLIAIKNHTTGQSSADNGYVSGGEYPTYLNVIEKFSFASDGNASDVGDLTQARYAPAGQSSSSSGYTSGGFTGSTSNVIDKFPFASDANATDVGDLTIARYFVAGQSSTDNGYSSGGGNTSPYSNVIDKFPFASNANAADVGDLSEARGYVSGQSSDVSGYTTGGLDAPSPVFNNVVDKFPFASDSNASDVGDLTQARYGAAGQQV